MWVSRTEPLHKMPLSRMCEARIAMQALGGIKYIFLTHRDDGRRLCCPSQASTVFGSVCVV